MSLNRTLVRGRDLIRTTGGLATEAFGPLTVIGRGLRRQAAWVRVWWKGVPSDRRGPALLLVAAAVTALAVLPYGPLIAGVGLTAGAAWAGRDRATGADPSAEAAHLRLRALYAALTPYLARPDDPRPLYTHDGDYRTVFTSWRFDTAGRLEMLELCYPPYFPDTEPTARSRVEQVLQGKAGRTREYLFQWDEETNRLRLQALAPLPDDIAVQRFATGPGELVLGVTDSAGSSRTVPVVDQAGVPTYQPLVLWHADARASETHLLVLGSPHAGASTLLRAIALQVLPYGDVMVIDGTGSGEHSCLIGRPGVHTVETSLSGALAALEWASNETDRRQAALHRTRRDGNAQPTATRPLWLLLDRPTELSGLAHAEGRTDPQELLETPLRRGRAAGVHVVAAERLEALGQIRPTVRAAARARVVLGTPTPEQAEAALGAPLDITPPVRTPAGRGYARTCGAAPVRVQVPAAPDPFDEDAPAGQRDAVIALLPGAGVREASAGPIADLVKPVLTTPPQPAP